MHGGSTAFISRNIFLFEGIVSGDEYTFVKILKIKSVLFVEAALRTDCFRIFWLPLWRENLNKVSAYFHDINRESPLVGYLLR